MTAAALGRIEFGGPDLPPRRLRDLLESHVDASPPGSRIDWATYYFRDRALAESLIRAHRRGVRVNLVIEPNPRRAGTNDAVIAMLREGGLGERLRLYSPVGKGRLHAKIYIFSHSGIAWVGSFNPSGDRPENETIIAEIGDQDRGDNLLLGIERPEIIAALRNQVEWLGRSPVQRLLTGLPKLFAVSDGDAKLYFYPRLRQSIVEPRIARLNGSSNLQGAISHLKKGPMTTALKKAARRGAAIALLVHDTERRVPSKLIEELEQAGIDIRRIHYAGGLPMHAKFLLLNDAHGCSAWLGSYNFNAKSRRRNAEVLLRTEDASTISALSARFMQIAASTA